MARPTDEEKWIPSREPKITSARTFFSGSLRKRRMLVTGSIVCAVIVLGSWYWYIGELPRMGEFWKSKGEAPSKAFMDLSDTPSKPYQPNHIPILPSVDIYKWGLSNKSAELLDGLTPWPVQARYSGMEQPLSSLGKTADDVYNMGYRTLQETATQLDIFISNAFPEAMQGTLRSGIARYLSQDGSKESWDKAKNIWQTDKNREKEGTSEV